ADSSIPRSAGAGLRLRGCSGSFPARRTARAQEGRTGDRASSIRSVQGRPFSTPARNWASAITTLVVARSPDHFVARPPDHVVARSPDRATRPDRRSPLRDFAPNDALPKFETFGRRQWHGQETVPQQTFAPPSTTND